MTRLERMKLKRRMQRRIRMVVEERRMASSTAPPLPDDRGTDPDATMEIPRSVIVASVTLDRP